MHGAKSVGYSGHLQYLHWSYVNRKAAEMIFPQLTPVTKYIVQRDLKPLIFWAGMRAASIVMGHPEGISSIFCQYSYAIIDGACSTTKMFQFNMSNSQIGLIVRWKHT